MSKESPTLLLDLERKQLRTTMRAKRVAMPRAEQTLAAQQATAHLLSHPDILQAQHIALFFSFEGEIDTQFAVRALWKLNKQLYLPVLHPFHKRQLLFLAYTPATPLFKNRFGILEPQLDVREIQPINCIDRFITPLTAFDQFGGRLGMGGGFYDYTLSQIDDKKRKPIGFAYDCQQADKIPMQPWDLKLPSVVTNSRIIWADQNI